MKRYKIVLYTPGSSARGIRQAMGEAGAGEIGNYSHCSFSTKGITRFKPNAGADPTVGEVGKLAEVEEERIETICTEEKLRAVLKAIKENHPYEDPAVDVYPIEVVE